MAPFKDAVDTGVGSIMLGLTEYGDSRIIDNKYLITEKLKNEMGFKGIVVSDWFGLYEYAGTLRYNANVRTINAGIDMAMLPFDYKIFVKDVTRAVSKGDISEERINDATSRILAQKFKSGLFDRVIVPNVQNVGTAEHRELARLAVASSAVLLKNDGNVLPLSKNTNHIRIAGSGADNIGRQAGGWTVEWQGIDGNSLPGATSILEGIKQVTGDTQNIEYDIRGYFADTGTRADVGIVLVSEKPYAEGFGDNEYPMLEPEDKDAIRRVKQSAEKVVIIVVSGRPLMMNQEMASVDAVVAAWLPGSEGAGIADVIFGDKPFVAKLPIDWPARMSQVPIRTNGQTADGTVPLFKRGYGLQP